MSELLSLSTYPDTANHLQGIHSIRARNLEKLISQTNILLKSIISSDKARERRVQFLNKIQALISPHFPSKRIVAHLFGSSITGLDFGGSDCDVALETEWNDSEVTVIVLARILRAAGMRNVVSIPDARVPIVKFYDPIYRISCDINVNNILGVHNSQMIKAYLSIDDRVKRLIMLIKYWAKRRGINSSSEGTYSSYCYVLMAIFFLQNIEEPILPSLQQISLDLKEEKYLIPIQANQRFRGRRKKQSPPTMNYADVSYFKDLDILSLYFKKPSNSTLPSVVELFVQFCVFYSRIIKTSDLVISIRTGKLMPMKEVWANRDYLLYVEDPFDLERNVACTASVYGEKRLVYEMKRVVGLFQAGNCTLETLFEKIDERSLNLEDMHILPSIGLAELINNQRSKPALSSQRGGTKSVVSNDLKKSKKKRNKVSEKPLSQSKTNAPQVIEEYSLHASDSPSTHTIGVIELIQVDQQNPASYTHQDVTDVAVKDKMVKVSKDKSGGTGIPSPRGKSKTTRKAKRSPNLGNESMVYHIGVINMIEDEQQPQILPERKQVIKSTLDDNLKGAPKGHISSKSTRRNKTKSHYNTVDKLVNGLSALSVEKNPSMVHKENTEPRIHANNVKAKDLPNPSKAHRQNNQVRAQTVASRTALKQASKSNAHLENIALANTNPSSITPPTSKEDRNINTQTNIIQTSKSGSRSLRPRRGGRGTKKNQRNEFGTLE